MEEIRSEKEKEKKKIQRGFYSWEKVKHLLTSPYKKYGIPN